METNEQISAFQELLERVHKPHILTNPNHLLIDFNEVSKHNPELAEDLLDKPEETIKAAEIASERVNEDFKGKIRIENLPDITKIPIWEIRRQIEKFIKIEGYIQEMGDTLIRPITNKYECPNCGNTINMIRIDDFTAIKEPTQCGCGRKGKFKLLSQETIIIRKIMLEEDLMELKERQIPKRKVVLLERDLTSTILEKEMHIGKKVMINGWLKTYETGTKGGPGDLDTYFVANNITFLERGWSIIKVTATDKKKIKKMSQQKELIPKLRQSIMPTIHGEEEIKEALLIQLVGSENIYNEDGFLEDRGNIHIALVGNPGSGKSHIIKYVGQFWPIYRFASANTASGVGLIATATQEKQLENKWVLTAGVIPTCSGGLCSIDELDKMNKEDYGYLNNAMNDLKVFIDKAARGILDTDTAILTSLNPVGRIFMKETPIYEQIELPADLLDRFDLLFPVFAKTQEEDQRKVFRIGLAKRRNHEDVSPIYNRDTVMKYVAHARTITPKITEKMGAIIEDRVIKFMRPSSDEGTDRHISNRLFGIVFRLVSAYARLHLREEVKVDDLNYAMDLLVFSYKEQGLITPDGLLDFAKTERVEESAANMYQSVRAKLKELSKENKEILVVDVIDALKNDYDEDKIEEIIEKLRTHGEIFEPKRGYIQLI